MWPVSWFHILDAAVDCSSVCGVEAGCSKSVKTALQLVYAPIKNEQTNGAVLSIGALAYLG